MRRILAPVLLVGAVALVAAGCGGGDNGGGGGTAAQTTQTETTTTGGGEADSGKALEVAMRNIAFDPKDVTVKVGQRIEWENYDSVEHNVVATGGADFKSENFGKGGTFEFTPDKAGTIKYVCTLHPGMGGTITVTR